MIDLLMLPEAYVRPAWRTCPVPGRPWWLAVRLPTNGSTTHAKRVDGATVVLPSWPAGQPYDERQRALWAACAEHDSAHPIPSPDVRVGDVWAVCVSQTLQDEEVISQEWSVICVADEIAVGSVASRTYLPTILLASPTRPDLAPWSSARRSWEER